MIGIRKIFKGLKSKLRILIKPVTGFEQLTLISKRPYIFLCGYYGERYRPFSYLKLIACLLFHKRVYWLVICTWNINKKSALRASEEISKFRRTFKKHQFIFLANSLEEKRILTQNNISSVYCNSNSFVSEYIFKPNNRVKEFDAIYDARLYPFKQHHLAELISKLALIVGQAENRDYNTGVRNILNKATWLNMSERHEISWLSLEKVNDYINRAMTGLCLSKEEGVMRASMQYLLAGIPIVTVENVGGRDDFFDSDYVIWVKGDPESILAAVKELSNRELEPHLIRKKTLQRVYEHRKRFVDLVINFQNDNGFKVEFNPRLDSPLFGSLRGNKVDWLDLF